MMKLHLERIILLFFAALIFSACNILQTKTKTNETIATNSIPPASLDGTEIPDSTASTMLQPTVTFTESPTNTPLPTRPSTPTILNAYTVSDVPYQKGGGTGAMLVLPDQIWIGSMFGGLQEWDPKTGQIIMQVTSIQPKMYYDIEKEGNNHLWVLAGENNYNYADALYLLSLPDAKLVKRFDIKGVGDYGWTPIRLGISPGKLWVNDMTIDTDALKETHYENGLPDSAEFAYDNNGWMWVTGDWCMGCEHDLWIIDVNDPTSYKDAQHSGMRNVGVLESPMVLTDGKIWLTQTEHDPSVRVFLVAYDISNSVEPVFHVEITNDIKDINGRNVIAADDNSIWIDSSGTLYYYAKSDGHYQGSLVIGEDRINGLGFDGYTLWALSMDAGLVQIAVP
jgi:hypothetical protein